MLSKLALRNVKRQVGNYLIYFITVSLTVAMLFSVSNIIFSENLARFAAASNQMRAGLIGIVVLISAVVAFVLSYATSFMLRLRKREFGTYLTLGMTRRNILTIFIAETTVIAAIALLLGLALGLFIYQGLSAVMMHLMEMEFDLAAYSVKGLVTTVCLVVGIFLLASLTSAAYLKKVSIYDLIHGDQKVEKSVKHPAAWFGVTVISFAVMAGSLIFFGVSLDGSAFTMAMTAAVFIFAVSVIFFHIGVAKSLVYVLLRRKKLCNRGTNIFVLRQLSGSLRANAVMLGFLSFLLTFTIIGVNASFVQKAAQSHALDKTAPYDLRYTDNLEPEYRPEISPAEAEKIIEKYTKITHKYPYSLYTDPASGFVPNGPKGDAAIASLVEQFGERNEFMFMKLSDFNALITPLGYDAVQLEKEYLAVSRIADVEELDWGSIQYKRGDKTYSCKGIELQYPLFSTVFCYYVLPDEAVSGMYANIDYIVYDVLDGKYDALALKDELTYMQMDPEDHKEIEQCDFLIKEVIRQQRLSSNAILVIGALFVAVVFLLMAMAILALKTLSALADDKQRYSVLRRLGAGYKEESRALFRQTFSFFMLPFVLPLMMSIPVAVICQNLIKMSQMSALLHQIPIIAALTAGVMTAVYLLYYAVTYLIAKRTIIRKS